MKLTCNAQDFLLDGKPLRILSGAIHYFRVPRPYWADRLKKLKECGFNCVETYVPWNLHEPNDSEFDFTGMADIGAFLAEAQAQGLYAIVRPGPYICAEWEFGGLPWWLLNRQVALRCNDERFLYFVRRYFNKLLAVLKPHLASQGGNIIAMQVENEYGSYGNDTDYLFAVRQILLDAGMDCLLFTSDGDSPSMLTGGTMDGVLKTVNFGSRPERNFAALRAVQPEGPLMCTEFWNGWFDHWGEEHHTRDHQDAIDTFRTMLDMGASVNFYMFHGGTNFGFMNGANCLDEYQPTVTSYDYDAPVSEYGALTQKWYAMRALVEEKFGPLPPQTVQDPPTRAYGKVQFTHSLPLMENLALLGKKTTAAYTLPMEDLGCGYGFVLYRTFVKGPREEQQLNIHGLADRAQVFINGKFAGIQERSRENPPILVEVPPEGLTLEILVENMGRTNYGPNLADKKGITDRVCLGIQTLFGWEMYTLPMNKVQDLPYAEGLCPQMPALLKAEFDIEEPEDTFLLCEGFTKGVAYINGINLGRYFARGPQRTLYVPGAWLKKGKNELVLFEQEGYLRPEVTFIEKPIL